MNKIRTSILLLAAFLPLILQCQKLPNSADSIRIMLKTAIKDTNRVLLLDQLAWILKDDIREDVSKILNEGLNLSRNLKYKRGEDKILNQLAIYYLNKGNFDRAESLFLQSIEIRKQRNDKPAMARSYNNLGLIARRSGDFLNAIERYSDALEYATEGGDSLEVARICSNLGALEKTLGDYSQSLNLYHRALVIREIQTPQDSNDLGKVWMGIGGVYEFMGQYDRAETHYLVAKGYFEHTQNKRELSSLLNNLGNVAEFGQEYERAIDYYRTSIAYKELLKDTLSKAISIRNIGLVYMRMGQWARARSELLTAFEEFESSGANEERFNTKMDLAEIDIWTGNPRKAMMQLDSLVSDTDVSTSFLQKIHLYSLLSIAAAGVNDFENAARWNNKAVFLRNRGDAEMNQSIYEYDKLLLSRAREEKLRLDKEILVKDLVIAREKSRTQLIFISALILILILVITSALWRIRMLQNKRKAAAAEFEIQKKTGEISRLIQEKELELLQTIVVTEDKERKRIAHDIHDQLGIELTTLKEAFSKFKMDILPKNVECEDELEKIDKKIDQIMAETRQVSHNLESPMLRDFGLQAALRAIGETLIESFGYEIELNFHGLEDRLGVQTEMNLFMITKEFFNNTIRHANASSISLQILKGPSGINLTYEDNGKGLKLTESAFKPGIGLQSIYTRVKAMDGEMKIDSDATRGTVITIDIPEKQ